METKFKIGDIVKQVECISDPEDPICKIIKVEDNMLWHVHRNHKEHIKKGWEGYFKPLPKLLQILYDDF